MRKLPSIIKISLFPLLLSTISLLIAWLGEPAANWLQYGRDEIRQGQLWRLFSGHLVHLTWTHLMMNIAGLALIWALFQHLFRLGGWIVITSINALAVSIGLLLFNPEVAWYVGLSGILHGMFSAGLIASIRVGNRMEILLLMGFIAKLAWEQTVGPTPGSEQLAGGRVLVDAHLYGAIFGAVSAAFWPRRMFNPDFPLGSTAAAQRTESAREKKKNSLSP